MPPASSGIAARADGNHAPPLPTQLNYPFGPLNFRGIK